MGERSPTPRNKTGREVALQDRVTLSGRAEVVADKEERQWLEGGDRGHQYSGCTQENGTLQVPLPHPAL